MAITDDETVGRLEPGRAGIRGEILPPERISRLILDLRAAVRDRSLRTWVTAAERLVPSCAAVLWLHPRPLTSCRRFWCANGVFELAVFRRIRCVNRGIASVCGGVLVPSFCEARTRRRRSVLEMPSCDEASSQVRLRGTERRLLHRTAPNRREQIEA
jgi:hypothetical protein